jgi:hypothetical protein
MKGPFSADRLFFISSLTFAASFVLYTGLNYLMPLPIDPNYMPSPTSPDQILNSIGWALSCAGIVTCVLGLVARR